MQYRIVVIPCAGNPFEVPGTWSAATATEHARTHGYEPGTVVIVERDGVQYRLYVVDANGIARVSP